MKIGDFILRHLVQPAVVCLVSAIIKQLIVKRLRRDVTHPAGEDFEPEHRKKNRRPSVNIIADGNLFTSFFLSSGETLDVYFKEDLSQGVTERDRPGLCFFEVKYSHSSI